MIALDVGYGQLDWSLRNDERVVVLERTNVRNLDPADLPWRPDGVPADLSFISLTVVLPALARSAVADADFVLLVKPQFEAGRAAVSKGGVVRDPQVWRSALARVEEAAAVEGLGLRAVVPSPLRGPAGNVEFFIHLQRGRTKAGGVIDAAVAEVAE